MARAVRAWEEAQIALPPIAAILSEARFSLGLRCLCPTCLRLDARFPNEGYQLALVPYRINRRDEPELRGIE